MSMAEDGGGAVVTGPSISIESGRDGRVTATLTFQAPDGVDLSPLLSSVGAMLRASFAANIDSGQGYAPLKPGTLRQKALHGYPTTPLVRSRLLRNSLARSNTTANVSGVTRGGAVLKVGTNVPYAAVQQEGGGNGIPARPFVVVGKAQEAAIAALVASFNRQHGPQRESQRREARQRQAQGGARQGMGRGKAGSEEAASEEAEGFAEGMAEAAG